MYSIRVNDVTGVILAGGKSRRMGKDKAFLEICGRPLIERLLQVFREIFGQIVLAGDRPERFAAYGLRVVPDIYPGSPLGGLYTGLHHARTDYVFVAPCDLLFPNRELLRYICSLKTGFDAVVPATEQGFEPLFALYSRRCLEPIRRSLEKGNFRVIDFYKDVLVRKVSGEELARFDKSGKSFVNVNTPEEFTRASKEWETCLSGGSLPGATNHKQDNPAG